jgi:hypothetical protein
MSSRPHPVSLTPGDEIRRSGAGDALRVMPDAMAGPHWAP